MILDFSENLLTDTSIRSFAELIRKFQGFRQVNMAELNQKVTKKDTGY